MEGIRETLGVSRLLCFPIKLLSAVEGQLTCLRGLSFKPVTLVTGVAQHPGLSP